MFAFIYTPEIAKRAHDNIIKLLTNPEESDVALNINSLELIQELIENMSLPVISFDQKSKIKIEYSVEKEIFIIKMAAEGKKDVQPAICKVFDWGWRFRSHSGKGLWVGEWGSDFIRFWGRRNSFLSASNALFGEYSAKEITVVLMTTTEEKQKLILKDVELKPWEIIDYSEERARKMFYSPIKCTDLNDLIRKWKRAQEVEARK